MTPSQPTFLKMPFAANGDKNTIPQTTPEASGAASLNDGFPKLTETPISKGGIPPMRKDFNGVLNWLSSFDFFLQSGGVFSWSEDLDYTPPCIVYHKGVMWWNVKACGASSTVKEPTAANSAYWIPYIKHLLDTAETQGVKIAGNVAIGTIIAWASANSIDAKYGTWIECNGQSIAQYPDLVEVLGSTTAPNFQGLFLRGAGSQTINGTTYTGTLGEFQGDAIRNITGHFASDDQIFNIGVTGVFAKGAKVAYDADSDLSSKYDSAYIEFDASNVVPTAEENRPANIGVRYMIKAAE